MMNLVNEFNQTEDTDMKLHKKTWAVMIVVHNERIRNRLPRITALARKLKLI